MSDHLMIRVEDRTENAPRIHVRDLIAFFPKEGFLAFEGYGWIPIHQLPYTVEVWRYKEDGTRNGHVFNIRITAAYKKDVLEPDEALEGHVPCGIQFFPCDLILYRFEGVPSGDDATLANVEDTLPYCIDDRFTSIAELIDAYTGLLDLPVDPWKSYESRMEDMPFYTGYYHVKKRDKNMYA